MMEFSSVEYRLSSDGKTPLMYYFKDGHWHCVEPKPVPRDGSIRAPSHLTAAQIKHALKATLARTVDDPVMMVKSTHPQRIKREMLKLGACKFHGVLMLESTEATRFILSHVSEDLHASDASEPATTSPQG